MDYGEACKHEIGGWIMMKPGNMEWRVDVSEPGQCGVRGWIVRGVIKLSMDEKKPSLQRV